MHRITGLSKGFGFISFSAKEEAQLAIAEMNGFRVSNDCLIDEYLKRVKVPHFYTLRIVGQEETESSAQATSK